MNQPGANSFAHQSQKRRLPFIIATVFLLFLGLAQYVSPSQAAAPTTLPFSARLTTENGFNVGDGSYDISFRLYSQPTGGSPVWSENQTVTVLRGEFAVYLGTVTSFSSAGVDFNQSPLYLAFEVSGDPEMSPRYEIGSVPSALNAQNLDGLSGSSYFGLDQDETVSGDTTFTGGISIQPSANAGNALLMNTGAAFSGNLINLQVNGSSRLSVAENGNTIIAGSLTAANGASISNGLSIPTGNLSVSAGSATISGTVNGQTISSAASFTGTVTTANRLTISSGGFGVTGNSNLIGNLNVAGTITATSITGGIAQTGQYTNTFTPADPNAAWALAAQGSALATQNSALLALGDGPFDGVSAQRFAGSAGGTIIGTNVASGFTGNLIDLQIGGDSKFSASSTGEVTAASTLTVTSGNIIASGGNLDISGNGVFGGDLDVTGASTLADLASGNTVITGTVTASGLASLNGGAAIAGTLSVSGASSLNGINNNAGGITNAGAISGATSGSFSGAVSAGSLGVTNNATVGGTLSVTSTINGATISGGTLSGGTVSGGNVSGGTITGGSLSSSAVNGLSVSAGVITSGTWNATTVGLLYGGTGATDAGGARTNLGAAASGANSDITSLTGLTTDLSVAQGGTGASNFASKGVLYGNGAGALQVTAAGTSGQMLVANATGVPTFVSLSGDATIDADGIITLDDSGVTANSYGSATQVPVFTVDSKGRVTVASTTTISGTAPGGSATGDLSGSYPNPTVAKINGVSLGSTVATAGNLLIGSGTEWVSQAVSGDISVADDGTVTVEDDAITTLKVANGNITNAKLQNSSLTVTAGTGLSGGGSVSLGGTITINNTGVLSLAGTANQISVSASTGAVTLSLPQSIAAASSPTFAGLTLTTALSVGNGGTGSTSAAGARTNLGAAASGANSDITSLSGLTGAISGATTINGATISGGTLSGGSFSAGSMSGGTITGGSLSASAVNGLSVAAGVVSVGTWTGTAVDILYGGTGSTSASGARSNLGAAASGANSDITSLSGLTTSLSVAQGGTGAITFTSKGLLYGNGTGALQVTAAGSSGQMLVANASGVPTFVALSNDATLSDTGALTLANSGVSANTYGDGTTVPQIAVDSKGRITNVTNVAITGAAPSGAASGDLSGSFPSPTVAKINGVALGSTTATEGNLLLGSGTEWVSQALSGDATIDETGTLTIDNNAITTLKVADGNITNAKLQNSSLTVTAGTGMSGGGSVSLGGTVTLTNAGVTGLTGTANQISVSASTGSVTLSLPQSIAAASSPTFAGLTLTTALSVGNGGTGATSAAGARSNLGAAASAANSDITSLTGLTGAISGATTGGFSGTVSVGSLTTTGTISGATTVNGATISGGTLSGGSLSASAVNGLSVASGTISAGTWNGTAIGILYGGTGATDAGGARTNLGAAASGANSDITSLAGLTTALSVGQGGTGLASYTSGDLLYASGTTTIAKLGIGSNGNCLVLSSSLPSWGSCGSTTEADTLASVTGRGATTSTSVALNGGITTSSGYTQSGTTTNTFTATTLFSRTGANAVAISGAPINTATLSLLQIGNAIAGGNVTANGGTYIGLNAPSSGAGSVADLMNLQVNDSSKFKVTSAGALTLGTALAVGDGGTGSTSAAGARANLSAAASGANSDITSLTGLTGAVSGATTGTFSGTITAGGFTTAGAIQGATGILSTSLTSPLVYGSAATTGSLTLLSTSSNVASNEIQTITANNVTNTATITVPTTSVGAGGTFTIAAGASDSTVRTSAAAVAAIGTTANLTVSSTVATVGGSQAIATKTAVLPSNRSGTASAFNPATNKTYIFGGSTSQTDIVEYDTLTDTITTKSATLPYGSHGSSAVFDTTTGKAYVIAGNNYNTILEYDPVANTVTTKSATLPYGSFGASSVFNPATGKIYIFAGVEGTDYHDEIVEYDPVTDTVTTMTATLPSGRYSTSAAFNSATGKAYIFGGYNGGALDEIVEYDIATDSVTTMTATLPTARDATSAVFYSYTGKAYIFGGNDLGGSLGDILEYDPDLDSLTDLAINMPGNRYRPSAIFNDFTGKAYIFGGGRPEFATDHNNIYEFSPAATTRYSGTYTFTFQGALAATDVSQLTTATSGWTTATGSTPTILGNINFNGTAARVDKDSNFVTTASVQAPAVYGGTTSGGNLSLVSNNIGTSANEVQTITATSAAGSGTITVPATSIGAGGNVTIALGDTPSVLRNKLAAVASIGSTSNVFVSGSTTTNATEAATTKSTPLPASNYDASAVFNPTTGKAYVFGGISKDTIVEYDTENNSISTKSETLPLQIAGSTAEFNNSTGMAYIFGGLDSDNSFALNTIYEYNPSTDSLISKGTLPNYIQYASSAFNQSTGKAYIFGGYNDGGIMYDSIIEYNTATNAATTKSTPLPQPMYATSSAMDSSTGKAYIFGGYREDLVTGYEVLNTILEYDTATNTIATKTATLPTGYGVDTSAVYNPENGKFYIFGGNDRDYTGWTDDILEYDPINDSINTQSVALPTAGRSNSSAIFNPFTGKAYIFGGQTTGYGAMTAIVEYITPIETPNNGTYTITFQGTLANTNIPQMTTATSNWSVATTTNGSTSRGKVYLNGESTYADEHGNLKAPGFYLQTGGTDYLRLSNSGTNARVMAAAGNLQLYTSSGSNHVLLQPTSGNVGIGTNSPTLNLSLGNSANKTFGIEHEGATTTSGKALTIQAGNAGSLTTGGTGGNIIIQAGNAGGSDANAGGAIILQTGTATSTGATGYVEISGGAAGAHLKSSQTTAPTIATPTSCGTSPTASVTAGSTDMAGSFIVTAGSGSPSNCSVALTFNKAYGAAPKSIQLTPATSTAPAKNLYVSASTATTFTVIMSVAPAASEPNTWYYTVIE
ncbi:MAG: hypothetical protein K0S20_43 [Patescibacteria group bacterium]|jgi:N-acetylneuraminic acid mutarotase|nr:hypothetical protein [Patescibacteria group bacterium]